MELEKENIKSESGNCSEQHSGKRKGFFKNGSNNYENTRFEYASRNYPCDICGKPSWCTRRINAFGEIDLALCQRVSSGSVKQARDGSYIHVLNQIRTVEQETKPTNYAKPKKKTENLKADAERCNAVYSALLEEVQVTNETSEAAPLYSYHADNLLERGLGDDTIVRNGYASVPEEKTGNEIAEKLSERFDLKGVAGFYKDSKTNRWKLNTYRKGFYVPFRNPDGLILGMQIRLDKPIDSRKYVWLSSPNQDSGASSGSPLHFVNPHLMKESKAVLITEGALKADVIGELNKVAVIAIAGVNAARPEFIVGILDGFFPYVDTVFLAFDMDFQTNGAVARALSNMETALLQRQIEVNTLIWDIKDGKGFDDYLLQEIEGENGK